MGENESPVNAYFVIGSRHYMKSGDRKKQNKDTYVLFNYTYSSKYSNTEKDKFCSLVIKENKFLTESDYLFLNLEKDKRGKFIVNEDMDCTATKANSA